MATAETFPELTQTVTQDTIQAYADLSGDYNPLHVDPDFAAGTPFGSTIAHGPIALQTLFVAVTQWLGREDFPPGSTVSVTYRAPVRPGDAVTCHVTSLDTESDPVALEAECRNQRDETVIAVSATLPRDAVAA
jgi:3-hydroxybutyryl-CoA dehydratase